MAAVAIRNLSDSVHRALKARAKRNGRSAEAEMRAILEAAVAPQGAHAILEAFSAFRADTGGVDLEFTRRHDVTEPIEFA